jgi:2-amino-4-hydroxy-6-hydroxymethyldihydropteridine diphosphokinase
LIQSLSPNHGPAVLAYIGIGANLGDALQTVQQAIASLARLPHTALAKASSLYRSAPVQSSGPDYINAVAAVHTHLSAPDLLTALQNMEQAQGRERPYPNAPRTLDLDLLLYGQASVQSPQLTLPHPRMWQRAFVLLPLAEIAPSLVSQGQLLAVQSQAITRC